MTDRQKATNARAAAARKRKGRVGPKSVIAVGTVTFVAFLSLLGWQVAVGKDPALGHGKQKRKVVHRRVKHYVIKKIEVQPTYNDTNSSGYSDGGYSSGGYSDGGYSSGGSSSYSAPTYSAPTYTPPPPVSSGPSGG